MIPTRLLCCCYLLSFIFIAVAPRTTDSKLVTSLPGFDGRLPFRLHTGYVEVDPGTELFYYFVESEAGGEGNPFLLWLTGGDRCSAFSGLAYEIGPVRFVLQPYNGSLPRLHINPNSWTKVAHILFVDSPVGAGFSFSKQPKGYEVGDVSSSLQLHNFLIKWFSDHPTYLKNPFYIGGDSYAGKLVPYIAHIISQGIEAGNSPHINLKGYLVGNPSTGESIDISSKVPYAHGVGIISDQLYETILGHCQGQDYMFPTNDLCAQALDDFNHLLSEVQQAQILLDTCVFASTPARPEADSGTEYSGGAGRRILVGNPPPRPPFGCVTYKYYLSYFWANAEVTRNALGIKEGSVGEWVRCHNADLPYTIDLRSSIEYHRNVTANGGYRALVYSGDHDAVVPHLGTQAWIRSLGFPVAHHWRAWHLHGQSAGFTLTYSNNMTFATIKGGGHTAPEYEPERCFAMFSRWILDKQL
ncbi:hypothetical protein CFC21_048400 [Triticum aestivum]|uniref:Serine carboxypeptidase-like 18 n=4 Tax=Triticinae TaxID=1648030 RepID=A0A9R1FZM7_WHEAT|nr:serine carboxypeptidase-like 18 [Aegilops tauschii subsp. strangulata]XP_044353542.1 serine carboxypeptidase-like 18 [Triticum aestivum]KAF7037448.1 hypothetical protein CFC21_047815 [Triticum aestivum]KAF7038195.1 hypothetical protein CFC21_048400 [Triticum aestivum]